MFTEHHTNYEKNYENWTKAKHITKIRIIDYSNESDKTENVELENPKKIWKMKNVRKLSEISKHDEIR